MRSLTLIPLAVALVLAGCAAPEESVDDVGCPAGSGVPDEEQSEQANDSQSRVTVWVQNDAPRDAVFCVTVNGYGPVRAAAPEGEEDGPSALEAFRLPLEDEEVAVEVTEARDGLDATERFSVDGDAHVVVTLTEAERLTIELRTTTPERG